MKTMAQTTIQVVQVELPSMSKELGGKDISETDLMLSERFAQHLRSVTQDNGLPVAIHLILPGHSNIDIKITVLVACFSSNRNCYL
jgi:hypothetical protein